MKRILTFLTILLVALAVAVPAHAVSQDMWAYVYSWDGKQTLDGKPIVTKLDTGITFKVLAINTDTKETLTEYNDDTLTSLTNPVSTEDFASASVCNKRVAFRVDPTDATNDRYVDLIVVNKVGGYTEFIENFDKYTHTIIIDQRPNIQHHGMYWWKGDNASTETRTAINFDYDTTIESVILEVTVRDAAETIQIGLDSLGTNGDQNGFVAAGSVATLGYVVQSAANMGDLLDDGTSVLRHTVFGANEQQLTYTLSTGSGTPVQSEGYIHYYFTRNR